MIGICSIPNVGSSTALRVSNSVPCRRPALRMGARYPRPHHTLRIKAAAQQTAKSVSNLRKNCALGGIFFANLFVYTITRDMKDVMFVLDCGAEYIPFVKTWINLPVSIAVASVYQRMLRDMNFHTCYRIMYASMMLISAIVGIGIYPMRETLAIQSSHALLSNWVVTLYYVLSPIYGSIIISVLFWSLANMYTEIDEAKRIYPLMGFVANIALIVAGMVAQASCSYWGTQNWNANVSTLCVSNLIVSTIALLLHRYIETSCIMTNSNCQKKKPTQDKHTFRTLIKEPFVINMIVMTASYGLMVSLFETIWKHNIKLHFTHAVHYTELMASISFWKGVCTMFFMCLSSFFLKHMSWLQIALITPMCLMIIGAVFFVTASSCYGSYAGFVVMTGAVMVVLLKSLKYAFTDPCKEIAFIPASDLIKTQGKATVNIVSSPIGKSGGSFIQQVMFLKYPIASCIPAIGGIYMLVSMIWIRSIAKMNHIIHESEKQDDSEKVTVIDVSEDESSSSVVGTPVC